MSPRHSRARSRRLPWAVAGGLVLAVAAVAGGAVLVVPRMMPACASAPITVAVTPTFVDPLTRAVDAGRSAGRIPDCAEIRVEPAEAPAVRALLADDPAAAPDVWIPESSVWLAAAPGPVREVRRGSVASSIVSVVLPSTDSDRYGPATARLSWPGVLTAPTPPQLADLGLSASARLTLVGLWQTLRGPDGSPTAVLAASVLGIGRTGLPSEQAGFDLIGADGAAAPAFVSSTRAVRLYNDARPATRAVALQPVGAPLLDHPFVDLVPPGRAPQVTTAVEDLRGWLATPGARAVLDAAGYTPARDAPAVDAATVDAALRAYEVLLQDSSVLAVIDVSGSMAASTSGGRTRVQLAAQAATAGVQLFPPTFSVGLWTFTARPAPEPDWDVLVPTGPLEEPFGGAPTRREALLAGAARIAAVPDAGTALYATVLAAVRSARDGYTPDREHTVVVFTDGRDEQDDGIGLDELLATLQTEADPDRPVAVITVAAGPEADLDALTRIARATQGRSYATTDPADIRTVFLDALTLRLCRPTC